MQASFYEFLKQNPKCEVLVTANDKQSEVAKEVALYLGFESFVLPDFRANFGDDLRSFSNELGSLLYVLNEYYHKKSSKKLLISPIRTLLLRLPNEKLLQRGRLEFGDTIELEKFKKKLLFWGYSFVDVVESVGEVSFRGDIVDIFSPNFENPKRISLFDDEIESIREFSTSNQKSKKDELESFIYFPALFSLDESEHENLELEVEDVHSDAFIKDLTSLGLWVLDDGKTKDFLKQNPFLHEDVLGEIEEISLVNEKIDKEFLSSLSIMPKTKEYKDIIASDKKEFLSFHENKKVTILASNEALLKQFEIEASENIIHKQSSLVLNVMGEDEIIISLNSPFKKRRKKAKSSIILDELKPNDYVVHESYGVGVFKGLQNTTVLGVSKDFVLIEYQGDDKLLLPVENLDAIDKYISGSGVLASVDRLGKGSFTRLKEKAQAKLFEIAKEIVATAAKRELIDGKIIKLNSKILNDFMGDLGFVYTDDQLKAVEDIMKDLKSSNVMDRLLSADVGFGKTEVAMNAILATVKSGYQALFLAPTTLLSSQHFKTLHERLSKFGVIVRKLDRFTSAKEKKTLLQGLEYGEVDVVVGTHSLLGVKPQNLGLLIIDEEHKFGVKQKEKLKQLSQNVHLLSMSATPIPRSLNLALSSIKGYSQILTPPNDREDVRSFVKEYDEKLLKEVILRELRRAGQIFYVHNRIASIDQKAKEIREIYPKIRILTLHSKVSAAQTEKEMLAFENGEYDMLLSTSIIESGIHLPNVNTIIIENADRFGMADLHQLRGRVGRGKRQGYCYFLVENKDVLSEDAKKRLVALEANSFLGSGSVLAYHDLEIRGGGNIVGEAQSGHIKNIGYSLYLKMLEEAINTLLNNQTLRKKEVDLKLSISAYLSDELISEDRVRLELYRRLSKCESVHEVYEIEGEIEDRFGKIDSMSAQFLQVIIAKILASSLNIKSISSYGQSITLTYDEDKKVYLKARSKDSDDILHELLVYLRKEVKK